MAELKKLDNVTKAVLIVLVVAISYFLAFLILSSLFFAQPTNMMDMMNQMMTGGTRTSINLLSLIIALIIGFIISFYLFKQDNKISENVTYKNEYNIIKKALSEDEKKILEEIKKAGEITQDSLRFRLGWSKAKISTILTNLDRKGIIQRERTGKTYKVYLQKSQR